MVASSDRATVKRARFAFTVSTSWSRRPASTPGNRAVFPREDPWLCVPVSRRVCPGRWSTWSGRRSDTNGGGPSSGATCAGSTSGHAPSGQCRHAPRTAGETEGAARRPLRSVEPRAGGDPLRTGSGRRWRPVGRSMPWWRGWPRHRRTSVRQCHFIPAPSVRAMVASSDRAMVKRARFAFTTPPHGSQGALGHRQPGGLPEGRSLALRPRLATGLPWTVVHRGASIAPSGTLGGRRGPDHRPVVPPVRPGGVSAATHRRACRAPVP